MSLRLLAVLLLVVPLSSPAAERNPFLKPALPALPAPGALGALALPAPALPAAPLADEKIWDTVDLVAISRSLILMRPQGGTSLAVHPGTAFRFAGEWWMAMLEADSMVKIHRGREGKGGVAASLWLNSPAARVIGVGAGVPGMGGQPGAQPLGQAPVPAAAGMAR